MLTEGFLLEVGTWVIRVLYWGGLVPQLILNYKHHSVQGVSDFMLLGYFNGYLFLTYYVSCLDFPTAYRIMVPLTLMTVMVMVVQRFVYDKNWGKIGYFVASLLFALVSIPFAFKYTNVIGNLFGWAAMITFALYQFPQLFKVYFEQSVMGFSFLLVTAIGIGNMIETIIAVTFGFPPQSVFGGLRGIFIYVFFCIEFLIYGKRARSFAAIRARVNTSNTRSKYKKISSK